MRAETNFYLGQIEPSFFFLQMHCKVGARSKREKGRYLAGMRQVAIIKIWNPETEKRKVPKLFFLELFLETFQVTKTSFPEKQIFSWNRVVNKCC